VYRISQLSDDIPVEHDITEKIMSLSCSREYENKVFL